MQTAEPLENELQMSSLLSRRRDVCSLLREDDARLRNGRPLVLRDVVLVHIDIVSVCVKMVVEDKRRIHEGARINKTSSLFDFHFLNVEDKTSVEYLERNCALATEENDFVVCDLVG